MPILKNFFVKLKAFFSSNPLQVYIINEINRVYADPPYSDLAIESINASKTGRYLDFQIVLADYGITESRNSTLYLYSNNKKISSFEIGAIDIGTKKLVTVTNVRVPGDAEIFEFVIITNESELSKENNRATVTPTKE